MATQLQPTIGEGFLFERKFSTALVTDYLVWEINEYSHNRERNCSPDFLSLVKESKGKNHTTNIYLVDFIEDVVTNLDDNFLPLEKWQQIATSICEDQQNYLCSPTVGSDYQRLLSRKLGFGKLPRFVKQYLDIWVLLLQRICTLTINCRCLDINIQTL